MSFLKILPVSGWLAAKIDMILKSFYTTSLKTSNSKIDKPYSAELCFFQAPLPPLNSCRTSTSKKGYLPWQLYEEIYVVCLFETFANFWSAGCQNKYDFEVFFTQHHQKAQILK